MDYIKEIKQLAEKCDALGLGRSIVPDRHKSLFEPVATMEQIREFERAQCISLPQMLVRYLTELGNGGAGPDYGIFSLEEMRGDTPDPTHLPPMLDHSLTDAQWKAFAEKYAALNERIDFVSGDEAAAMGTQLREMRQQLTAGGIFISTPGCTMSTILMCRGAAAGEVFVVDFDYMDQVVEEPWCGGKFEDWMIEGMRGKIEGG